MILNIIRKMTICKIFFVVYSIINNIILLLLASIQLKHDLACKNLTTAPNLPRIKLPIISEDAGAKIACGRETGNNFIIIRDGLILYSLCHYMRAWIRVLDAPGCLI